LCIINALVRVISSPFGFAQGKLREAESSPSSPLRVKTTFMPSGDEALHFRPLRGPPVEMTEAQILITIGITSLISPFYIRLASPVFYIQFV